MAYLVNISILFALSSIVVINLAINIWYNLDLIISSKQVFINVDDAVLVRMRYESFLGRLGGEIIIWQRRGCCMHHGVILKIILSLNFLFSVFLCIYIYLFKLYWKVVEMYTLVVFTIFLIFFKTMCFTLTNWKLNVKVTFHI